MIREFDYLKLPSSLVCGEIMNLLSAIHECRGKQDLYVAARADKI